ncbi:hypothetical protein HKD37_18G050825 [Glycine soja]
MTVSWAKRASTAKRKFSVLSATKESGRTSISGSCAKHEISALSAVVVFSQAQRMTDAKLKPTYSRYAQRLGLRVYLKSVLCRIRVHTFTETFAEDSRAHHSAYFGNRALEAARGAAFAKIPRFCN